MDTTTTGRSQGAALCGCPGHGDDGGATGRGISRRGLLGGALAAGALAGLASPLLSTQVAYAAEGAAYTGDVMLVLSFRGGADGLSIVVPWRDPDLYAWRPGIGVPSGALIAKDSSMFGLHPALAPLKPFWDNQTFGAVHACGMSEPNRSHFDAMEEMERAAPGTTMRTGWLDRTLGLRDVGTSFQAVQLGGSPSQSLAGPQAELGMSDIDGFRISGANTVQELAPWNAALTALHSLAGPELTSPTASALGAVATTTAMADQPYVPEHGVTYDEESHLARALRDVARLVKAEIGVQVVCVDFGDWDMHVDLGQPASGWMHDKLTDLSTSLASFMTDLGTTRMQKVTVVTLSEFGRRVEQNGSGGVDHGYGNAVLLLGGKVNGGQVHGTWPGLDEDSLVDGDLAVTTDYRTVLGEVLTKRCGVSNLSDVFPGMPSAPSIGVVSTG